MLSGDQIKYLQSETYAFDYIAFSVPDYPYRHLDNNAIDVVRRAQLSGHLFRATEGLRQRFGTIGRGNTLYRKLPAVAKSAPTKNIFGVIIPKGSDSGNIKRIAFTACF